jgi:dTDP-4-dehydrorhamnose 3,5-epimerase-like enzyme
MTGRFRLDRCDISGLVILCRDRLKDERGYLERMFCREELTVACQDKARAVKKP